MKEEELLNKLSTCLDKLETLVERFETAAPDRKAKKPQKTFRLPTDDDFVCEKCKFKGIKCDVCNFGGKFE